MSEPSELRRAAPTDTDGYRCPTCGSLFSATAAANRGLVKRVSDADRRDAEHAALVVAAKEVNVALSAHLGATRAPAHLREANRELDRVLADIVRDAMPKEER